MEYASLSKNELIDLVSRLEKQIHETRDLDERINLYTPIVEQAAESIAVTDLSGNYILFNKSYETMRGYTRDELFAKKLRDTYSEEERLKREHAFEEVMAKGYWKGELNYQRKDGTYVPTSCTTVLMRDKTGNPVAIIGLMTDITDLKNAGKALQEAKDEAERANRLKSYFLATMSHDIRTPINAILGFADMLSEEETDPEKRTKLGMILQSGRMLLELINDILDLSKIESGKYEIARAPFPLEKTIHAVKALFEASARGRGIGLAVSLEGQLPEYVSGDEKRIRQILMNIVNNALKFTEKGNISISCTYRSGRATIRVKDTGIGIPGDSQEIIFSEFSQADESISLKYGGTGLGLAICRKLLSMMEGTISVESEPGRGSEFIVELPLPAAAAPAQAVSGDASPDRLKPDDVIRQYLDGGGNVSILVSEDDLINQKYLEATLEQFGLSCELARDGGETLAMMRKTRYDIVLLDMQMPVMDGEEVLRTVLGEKLRGETVIIAQTAYAMTGDREKYLAMGCDYYLSKPIDRRRLKSIIAEILERKR
jgi:two-component system, chemotaxis family, CheB/CheR fusion protein